MPAPSLFDSALKMCIRNVRSITDIGNFEYVQIKPLLAKVEAPERLRQIEINCPQIQGEDAELWQKFIARDVPKWQEKNYKPKDPKKWYQVYRRYMKEQEEEVERDREMLRQRMQGLQQKRDEKTSKEVSLKSVKVPMDSGMRRHNGGVPIKGRGQQNNSVLTWNRGSRTQNVMKRARKEAAEQTARSRLAMPSQFLSGRVGQIRDAPAAMKREQQILKQPQVVRIFSSKKAGQPRQTDTRTGADMEERENRLRQIKAGGLKRTSDGQFKEPVTKSRPLTFSDDEDVDDLFDEAPKQRPIKSMRAPAQRPSANNEHDYPTKAATPKKPSDVISQMLAAKTKGKITTTREPSSPKPSTTVKPTTKLTTTSRPNTTGPASSPPPARKPTPPTSTTQGLTRGGSPPGPPKRPAPLGMMPRKKKEVDIFNRRPVKKPRTT